MIGDVSPVCTSTLKSPQWPLRSWPATGGRREVREEATRKQGSRRAAILAPMTSEMRPFDTSADAYARQTEAYQAMSGSDRVAIAFRLSAMARSATIAGIMARHPDYSTSEAHRALARLTLGDELVRRLWPGQPLVAP